MPDDVHPERPPSALLQGRRALEGVAGVEFLEDLQWWRSARLWSVRVRLSHQGPPDKVPRATEWYICCEKVYPLGSVQVFPAKERSLEKTFPHQIYNGLPDQEELPWRTGKLCLETEVAVFKRHGFTRELWTADARLRWHAERAIRWLHCAAEGTLHQVGDPFELPDFSPAGKPTLVFREEPRDLAGRESQGAESGLVNLLEIPAGNGKILAVKELKSLTGATVHEADWGGYIHEQAQEAPRGIWIRLPKIPVLEPWQAPRTWGELSRALQQQDVNLKDHLKRLLPSLRVVKRQKETHHLLLLGFPIPEHVGGETRRFHWLAIQLPLLARKGEVRNGFRDDKAGRWALDEPKFSGIQKLHWRSSECWNPAELGGRGHFSQALCSSKLLLIGAGALGSAVAELLARGGVRRLTILDHDLLAAGNLVRHTLGLRDLGTNKAQALAQRLQEVAPFASVRAIPKRFSTALNSNHDSEDGVSQAIQKAEVVVDLTASDEVLHHLEEFPWEGEKLFVSLSLGWQARRLYAFAARSDAFPLQYFCESMDPWIAKDREHLEDDELPREGVGCWHPVFPARLDRIWGMSAPAVEFLERAVTSDLTTPEAAVFESAAADAHGCALRRVA